MRYGHAYETNWLTRLNRARGLENVYFPLFIPLSYLQKEADHIEGFAKEMAVVTQHRLEQKDGGLVPTAPLEEPVIPARREVGLWWS